MFRVFPAFEPECRFKMFWIKLKSDSEAESPNLDKPEPKKI